MNPRSLRYFLELARELHFGRAAANLHITQPPLTKHIQGLERQLGVPLFLRTKRSVALTPAGIVLAREAQRIFAQEEEVLRAVRLAQSGETGQIRIGCVASVIFSGVQRIFLKISRKLPNIEIALNEMGSPAQVDALLRGRIDLGFVNALESFSGLASYPILSEPLMVALPAAHPLAASASVALSALRDEDFILFPRENAPGFHDLITASCRAAGFTARVRNEASHLLTVVGLVAMGRGVSLVPGSMRSAQLAGLVIKPLRGEAVKMQYSLVWKRDNPLALLPRVLNILDVPDANRDRLVSPVMQKRAGKRNLDKDRALH